jgi:hypothetical protein
VAWCVRNDADHPSGGDAIHGTDALAKLDVANTPEGTVRITIEPVSDEQPLIDFMADDAYLTREEAIRVATMLRDAVTKLDEITTATATKPG